MTPSGPLFTDFYQLTMAKAYWESHKQNTPAVFELFFRNCPFGGEYAIVAGHDRLREILENFRFDETAIRFLRQQDVFAKNADEFFEALKALNLSDIKISGLEEGEICFPRIPLLRVEGPLWKAQLLESALLNSINFASLCATYARRIRLIAAGRRLIEFGLRRAQGPDGAMTASRSSYLGGFDATSNVEAGEQFEIPVSGTMAHSFVQSFFDLTDEDFNWHGRSVKSEMKSFMAEDGLNTHAGELCAFLAFAKSFPNQCILLVDTYDSLRSGIPNAIRVLKLLRKLGFPSGGIRLDSGDLVHISQEARRLLNQAGLSDAKIMASNDLDETTIDSIQKQGAEIDGYGIGTQLVTCAEQPALGGVYKLCELDGKPRFKISEQTNKISLPSSKQVYRLYGESGLMLLDYLALAHEPAPKAQEEILALHPFDNFKRARVHPTHVRALLTPLFESGRWIADKELAHLRAQSLKRMMELRPDISRRHNPTPYKVSVSSAIRETFESLYQTEAPRSELK